MLHLARISTFSCGLHYWEKLTRLSRISHLSLVQNRQTKQAVLISGPKIFCKSFHVSSNLHKEGAGPQDNRNDWKKLYALLATGAIVGIVTTWMLSNRSDSDFSRTVSFKEFVEEILPSGEVVTVYVNAYPGGHTATAFIRSGAIIEGQLSGSRLIKITGIKSVDEFESVVRNAEKIIGISPTDAIPIVRNNEYVGDFLIKLALIIAVAMITYFAFSRLSSMLGSSANDLFSQMNRFSENSSTNVTTGVKFADVAGCSEAKQEVLEFVHYLRHPEKYQKLGAKMPRGCLLTGPPGVGKTLLAKAVASEAEVPFISTAGSDFVEMIGGLGARRVRELFEKARSVAPCIVYIDELDAVGAKRSPSNSSVPTGSSERDQTLNQILVEMDGILSVAHDVVVMASTNRVDILDKALLRPGRFDRHIGIELPTKIERKAIFEIHLEKLKLKKPSSTYTDRLANLSPGMSGADIANVCNEAAICAAREKHSHIDVDHFEHAFERVLGGSIKKSSALSPEERHIVAIHEAGHALVGWMLKYTDAIVKVSIVPRTKSVLGLTRTLPKEYKLYTRSMLMDIMSMRLAGLAAENLVTGSVTHGAEDDLKKVTEIAYTAVKHLGLSVVMENMSFLQDDSFVRPYSEALAQRIDMEVKKITFDAHAKAQEILQENRAKLDLLISELTSKEVLNYNDIVKLIGPSPHGNKSHGFDAFRTSSLKQ